jgi:hypothetical protein
MRFHRVSAQTIACIVMLAMLAPSSWAEGLRLREVARPHFERIKPGDRIPPTYEPGKEVAPSWVPPDKLYAPDSGIDLLPGVSIAPILRERLRREYYRNGPISFNDIALEAEALFREKIVGALRAIPPKALESAESFRTALAAELAAQSEASKSADLLAEKSEQKKEKRLSWSYSAADFAFEVSYKVPFSVGGEMKTGKISLERLVGWVSSIVVAVKELLPQVPDVMSQATAIAVKVATLSIQSGPDIVQWVQ